jgi:hypothetical protein
MEDEDDPEWLDVDVEALKDDKNPNISSINK